LKGAASMPKHAKHQPPWAMFSFFVNVLRLILAASHSPWL
jgi:hypothetical protein